MKPPLKIRKNVKISPYKQYELRALGYCCEVTAHRLSPKQLKELKGYIKREGVTLKDDLPNLEGEISGYDMYETNMWQTSIVPVLGSCVLGLYDDKNNEIFVIEDIENFDCSGEVFKTFPSKSSVLIACEEFKGTCAVWTFESSEVPNIEDFKFTIGSILLTKDEDIQFIEGAFFKGKELDKDYDQEFIVGKSSYSRVY